MQENRLLSQGEIYIFYTLDETYVQGINRNQLSQQTNAHH